MRLTKFFMVTFSFFSLVLIVFSLMVFTRSTTPFIGFPGGALEGEPREVPGDWDWTKDFGTIQLETRPGVDPYSVNLWGVGIGPHFYVGTSPEGTGWSNNLDADDNVRLLVGTDLFTLQAARVSDAQEMRRVVKAYAVKYESDPEELAATMGIAFRLTESSTGAEGGLDR